MLPGGDQVTDSCCSGGIMCNAVKKKSQDNELDHIQNIFKRDNKFF